MPGRHGNVTIDVESDHPRTGARQVLNHRRKHVIGQRPGAKPLDVLLRDRDQHHGRRRHRRGRPQQDVPVVRGEPEGFECTGHAQAENARKDQGANCQGGQER